MKEFLRNNIFVVITAIVCAVILLINTFVVQLGRAISGCMEPVIHVGDIMISTKIFSSVDRGDIIGFYEEGTGYVGKRIVGLGGETVSFKDGYVYINGEQLVEPYLDADIETNCTKTFNVPDGCVFLMGDNRFESYDSRYWENPYISEDDIKTKFIGVIFHKK